ncbi:MAG: VCBS repeat-containing protein, partial [Verrucomicrobiota bacterium]
MSLKNAAIIFGAAFVVALLIVTGFGTKIPSFKRGGKEDVVKKPTVRPKRTDLEMLNRFEGQSMDSILSILSREVSAPDAPRSSTTALLGHLPDSPLPYAAGVTARDPEALSQYLNAVDSGSLDSDSPMEQWHVALAKNASGQDVDDFDQRLGLEIHTDYFPVKMTVQNHKLEGACAVANLDNSPDLELISHGGTRIWKKSEAGVWELHEEIKTEAGVGIYPQDFDDDGDTDLLLIRHGGLPNSLLSNDGGLKFSDVTQRKGLLSFHDSTCARWVDFDQDGRTDLAIGNSDAPLQVYHQSAGGRFQQVDFEVGLWVKSGLNAIHSADLNGDGYPDVGLSIAGEPDRLMIASPGGSMKEWRFEDHS